MEAFYERAKVPGILFLLGALLARASLFGTLHPFGAAWTLASFWKGGWPFALWSLGGATLGAFSRGV